MKLQPSICPASKPKGSTFSTHTPRLSSEGFRAREPESVATPLGSLSSALGASSGAASWPETSAEGSWCFVRNEGFGMDPYIIPTAVPITHSLIRYYALGNKGSRKTFDKDLFFVVSMLQVWRSACSVAGFAAL